MRKVQFHVHHFLDGSNYFTEMLGLKHSSISSMKELSMLLLLDGNIQSLSIRLRMLFLNSRRINLSIITQRH